MPVLKRPDAEIYYEVHGSGFPLLIFAPGGLRSQLDNWRHSIANPALPAPYMNPMVDLASKFTVVALDQRNAGKSRGKVYATDGWHSFASDHLALMDHLGHKRFHVMGGCIGGTFNLTLCRLAGERVTAAIMQNPIGLHENRDTWDDSIRGFGQTMRERNPSFSDETLAAYGRNLYGTDFVFSVTRDFVRDCQTPMLLQPGSDKPHPRATSDDIARLAPNIEVQENWRGPEFLQESIRRVGAFLEKHTPK